MSNRFVFVGRRLAEAVPLLLGVLLIVFLLARVAPSDPALLVVGQRSTPEEVEAAREELGLNDPLPQQYLSYVGDVLRGDLGTSIQRKEPVAEVIGRGIPITLLIVALGALAGLMLAIPLAWVAARYRDRPTDRAVGVYSMVTLTVPAFAVGIFLLVFVALPTGWFPVTGYGTTVAEHARALVLPILTLAIVQAPLLVRSLRSEFIQIRESDYLAMATSAGIRPRRIVLRYELPNAVLPAITLVAFSVGYLLFGVVVVENTFGLPGLGQAIVIAVQSNDIPLIQGITLVFALVVVFTQLLADITFALIDPRIRFS